MRYILATFLIALSLPLSQTFSGRVYSIDFDFELDDNGYSEGLVINLVELTGVESPWYRVTILNVDTEDSINITGGLEGMQGYEYWRWEVDRSHNEFGHWYHGTAPKMFTSYFDDINVVSAIVTETASGTIHILVETTFPEENDYGADWNDDGDINIIDIVAIIDYILFGEA